MTTLIGYLIPIVIADAANPVLLAAVIYALASRRPYAASISVLVGWFCVYLVSGVILAEGIDWIAARLASPGPIEFGVQLAVGVFMLWAGFQAVRASSPPKRAAKKPEFNESRGLGIGAAFMLGASINLISLPFAVPYFAAVSQIVKADPEYVTGLFVLVLYNLLYLVPFFGVIGVQVIFREQSKPWLDRLSNWMEKIGNVVLPGLLLLLGAALLIDAVVYFVTGAPLIPQQ
jgi:cytochrome c biogenesis protein CcdA